MPTTVSHISRAYSTKTLTQVRANVGKNHHVTASLSVPRGVYNAYILGTFSITEGYDPATLIGPDFHVSLNVSGDNPLFTNIANRNWQEINSFKKNGNYQWMGATQLTLNNNSNTIEGRTGLRDTTFPIVPGDGFGDTTVFIFQVSLRLVIDSI